MFRIIDKNGWEDEKSFTSFEKALQYLNKLRKKSKPSAIIIDMTPPKQIDQERRIGRNRRSGLDRRAHDRGEDNRRQVDDRRSVFQKKNGRY